MCLINATNYIVLATLLLKNKDPGAFVVRDSQSYEGAFGLAVKVETPPSGVLQQVGGDLSKRYNYYFNLHCLDYWKVAKFYGAVGFGYFNVG